MLTMVDRLKQIMRYNKRLEEISDILDKGDCSKRKAEILLEEVKEIEEILMNKLSEIE